MGVRVESALEMTMIRSAAISHRYRIGFEIASNFSNSQRPVHTREAPWSWWGFSLLKQTSRSSTLGERSSFKTFSDDCHIPTRCLVRPFIFLGLCSLAARRSVTKVMSGQAILNGRLQHIEEYLKMPRVRPACVGDRPPNTSEMCPLP